MWVGIVDANQLDEDFELYTTDTVPTFRTLGNHRLTTKAVIKHKLHTDECSTRPSDDQPE